MAKKGKPARAQMPLRIPQAIRARIERAANQAGMSMNAEIAFRLHRSYEAEDRLGGARVVELIETIAAVMKSTGKLAGFYETGKLANQGEWLALPYAFDQATKAAMTILDHHRPPGKIAAPQPNVVEVIGVRETKVDPKESVARLHQTFAELGPLMAASAIKKREQDDG